MTQKRKTKKKTGIPKKDYDQLNFFYKLYYYFMCFFNETYCPDYPKYWNKTNGIAAEQTRGIAAEQTSGIAAKQTRVNNQLNRLNSTNGNNYISLNGREVTPRHARP